MTPKQKQRQTNQTKNQNNHTNLNFLISTQTQTPNKQQHKPTNKTEWKRRSLRPCQTPVKARSFEARMRVPKFVKD
jgi:hypothetical protein